jgi:hypothetical protein
MVLVKPVKTYDFNTHKLLVDEVEVLGVSAFPDGTTLINIRIYGSVTGKCGTLAEQVSSSLRYYISAIFVVRFEDKQFTSVSFREVNYGYVYKKNVYDIYDFVPSEELEELVMKGIKESNIPFAMESLNVVKPDLSLKLPSMQNAL